MNISPFVRRIVILCIGLLLILYGVIELIFKINLDPNIVNRVATMLMIAALLVLFVGRRNDRKNEQDKEKK
ncbi:MAG TPA: hypothetical protein PKK43_01230 [Spirochaetota bacterium]|nr:hypothetical protein [Spirochaetota bacterium]